MGMRTYKATGVGISLAARFLGLELRVTGCEALPDRPVLFVANHFTRSETFLVPYVIYHRFGRAVRSLATHTLFHGAFGRYLEAINVVSVRDPRRNRKIVGDLLTGDMDWVIYPEGGLIKNKKTGRRRKPWSTGADDRSAPRTGAAVLALKAALSGRRYHEACRIDDAHARRYYEEKYDISGPDAVNAVGPVIVPVNITFPRLRAGRNIVHTAARFLNRRLDPRLDEELQVEGTILFQNREISFHFGEPIDVADYLRGAADMARRVVSWLRSAEADEVELRRQAKRLTSDSMRHIYESTEVNLEHLFCYGLRVMKRDVVPVKQFHEALYLAALELRKHEDVRIHPILRDGIIGVVDDDRFEPLLSIVELAQQEGVLDRENGTYVINRAALEREHAFHDVRLEKMVQVIANEIEPVRSATDTVREAVNLNGEKLKDRLARAIAEADRMIFHRDYLKWHAIGVSKPTRYGEPFHLEAKRAKAGIVLVHGYLACPEQMRPLGEFLHAHGYSVYGMRLDGHGTAPIHMSEVTWEGWLESLTQAYLVMHHRHERVFLGGFSLGGVLSLVLAAQRGEGVGGVVSINTPLKLRHRLVRLVPTITHLDRAVRLIRRRPAASRRNVSENPDINYDVDYFHGLHQLRAVIRLCRSRLPEVKVPTLVVQSDDDPVVAPVSAELIRRSLGTDIKPVLRLPRDQHIIVRGQGTDEIFERILGFLEQPCGVEETPTA